MKKETNQKHKKYEDGPLSGPSLTVGEIFRRNLLTPFHLINLILAIAILIFGELKNLLFMIVVIVNAGIGIVQEIRAKRLVDRLSVITRPKALVIRDGKETEVEFTQLKKDDIVILKNGFQIGADAVVEEGVIETDESLLTGESESIKKAPGDKLFSGSFVVAGECKARVIHTGNENYATQIANNAKYIKKQKSEIIVSVNRIIGVVGAFILPIGIILFVKQYIISGISINDAVTKTVAALIAMIPEGLVLLTSVVLAVSIIRLSKRKALVQEMFSIEMLARVDTLCLDKTGTLTKGTMCVEDFVPLGNATLEELKEAVGAVAFTLNDNNPTAAAIRQATECPDNLEVIGRTPFSSSRKWSAISLKNESIIMGAAEYICKDETKLPWDEIKSYAESGLRVLLVAKSQNIIKDEKLPCDIQPIGFLLISDVIREGALETIKYFREEGVSIKIISGDNPVTVSMIAKRCGVSNCEDYIDMSKISDDEIEEAALNYTVFGRVNPQQKLQIIKALKSHGHTTGMTGDGVNDVMALKESDCSIVPASGTDAARNVGQIVLLDSDYSSVPHIVAEGRRSINNLQRSASLFLTKTIFSIIAGIIFIFVASPYPLVPVQLSLLGTLTIGVPSFFLGLQKNRERVKGHFLANVLVKALPGGITDAVVVVFASFAYKNILSSQQISTITVLLMVFVGFMVLFKTCWPFDKERVVIFLSMLAAFILAIMIMPRFFSLVITADILIKMITPALLAAVLFVVLSIVINKLYRQCFLSKPFRNFWLKTRR